MTANAFIKKGELEVHLKRKTQKIVQRNSPNLCHSLDRPKTFQAVLWPNIE